MIWIGFALIVVAAIAKAAMDIIAHKYKQSIFSWPKLDWYFNPELSHLNKHNVSNNRILLYLFKTVLVWTTDGWHLFQMIFLKCLVIGTVLITYFEPDTHVVIKTVLSMVLFGSTFELFYSSIFISRSSKS